MTCHLWFKETTSPWHSLNLTGIFFLSAVLTAAHIFPSFTGPSSRRSQFNRRVGESQTLFDKYYLLAGGGKHGGKFTSKNVSLHATSAYIDWRTTRQNVQTYSGHTTFAGFRGHDRKLTVHELKKDSSVEKKERKKLAYLCSRSRLCAETVELKHKTVGRRCVESVMRHPLQWPLVFFALAQIKFRSMFNELI